MFKKFLDIRFLNSNTGKDCFQFEFSDTEFWARGTAFGAFLHSELIIANVMPALINIYERRNLNVPSNLTLALQQYAGNFFNCAELFDCFKRNTPELLKYEKEIEKYLLLL